MEISKFLTDIVVPSCSVIAAIGSIGWIVDKITKSPKFKATLHGDTTGRKLEIKNIGSAPAFNVSIKFTHNVPMMPYRNITKISTKLNADESYNMLCPAIMGNPTDDLTGYNIEITYEVEYMFKFLMKTRKFKIDNIFAANPLPK